jgi:protein-S-isoprenylcysteine O-methyltransferase Ste14
MSYLKSKLLMRSIAGLVFLIVVLGALLFGFAWTLYFWQAWIYLIVFASSSSLVTLYLWKKDPKLLERRVKAGPIAEKERSQKFIQLVASIAFVGIFILAALDHRYLWSNIPYYLEILGDILVILGFFIVFLVFKENTFTSATIEIASKQKVITTGLYAIVRHPMYSGAFILLLGTPLALGTWLSFIMVVLLIFVIILRLLEEEKFLLKNLKGYKKYCQKVQYRLLPLIW